MKTIFLVLFLIPLSLLAQEPTMTKAPITEDDIVALLGLKVDKTGVLFGQPKYVTLRYEMQGGKTDWPLKTKTASVTLLLYIPAEGKEIKDLQFRLAADNGDSVAAGFPIRVSALQYREAKIVEGVYTVGFYDSEKRAVPVGSLRLITSDTPP